MKCLSCLLAPVLLLSIPYGAFAAETIALAGEGYGRTEIKCLIENVLDRELQNMEYEDRGEFLPADEFKNYSMVVIAGKNESRVYSEEESQEIEEFVQKGGRLLLIHQAPKMFPMAGLSSGERFLFGASFYMRENPESSVLRPEAPLLAGAFEATTEPYWLRGNVLLQSPEWEALVGTGTHILVGERVIGKGKAYYVGPELFRVLLRAKTEGAGQEEGFLRILKNIFTDTKN